MLNAANAAPAVDAWTDGTGAGLRIRRGPIATTPINYTGTIESSVAVVAGGNVTLAVPLESGTHLTVVNSSAAPATITNTTAGAFVIAGNRMHQFVFVTAVSATNWIPAQ